MFTLSDKSDNAPKLSINSFALRSNLVDFMDKIEEFEKSPDFKRWLKPPVEQLPEDYITNCAVPGSDPVVIMHIYYVVKEKD